MFPAPSGPMPQEAEAAECLRSPPRRAGPRTIIAIEGKGRMDMKPSTLAAERSCRARAIADAGGIEKAIASGAVPKRVDVTLSEALVLGLLRQGVQTYLCLLGHGSTEIAEVLRVYEAAGLLKSYTVRHETEASHAAAALRWVTGKKAAVVTSIGPGSMHALAGSLTAASDGLGVWYLFGDETSEDEGPNMQQIPRHEQHPFLKICAAMGEAYCLHTPGALATALRRGAARVNHPYRPGPFYLLLPMNVQPAAIRQFNLDELPLADSIAVGAAADDDGSYAQAAQVLRDAKRVVVRVGGGGRNAGAELIEFLELVDGVAVLSPVVTGVIPYSDPRNMTCGGSKGSLCGNYAMEHADALVAVGTRFVCQSDCSRTAYPNVKHVININPDVVSATHYGRPIALLGDAARTLRRLICELNEEGDCPVCVEAPPAKAPPAKASVSPWLAACSQKRKEWEAFKTERYNAPCLDDDLWGGKVLTQPAAIKIATDWARSHDDVVTFFDAGDVQANGFQIVEDDRLGRTFTETGASYMGFAVSALLASALADKPFYGLAVTGDGSFTINPQILIDGVEHGAHGCVLILDNRRMAAISGLQMAQYGVEYATNDHVAVDYIAWARAINGVKAFDGGRSPEALLKALNQAYAHKGLSLIYVPVYYGPDPLGGMGVFGRWNVGNWCTDTQALRHDIGL